MQTTYGKVFELETAVQQHCATKYWPLLKLLNKNLKLAKEHTNGIRERLQKPESVRVYEKAYADTQAEMAGEPEDKVSEALARVTKKHRPAVKETADIVRLEKEILRDTVEVNWVTISEEFFHEKNVLRIDPPAFLLFSQLDIVVEGSSKVTKLNPKKKRK